MKQTTSFSLPQPGIYPFWFWNGAMEEPELSRQLRLFQQSGCRGAAIHCRTGNRIEYLSDRWLELCRFTAEESRRIGFKLWLYDEAGYPSGNADGNVQKGHPELEQIFLQFEYAGADPDHPAAWTFLPGTRTGVSERDLPPGTPLLRFHLRRNPRHVDVFHPESCRRFLRFTHERYETVLKEFFGEVIEAVYTDDESYLMSGFYGLAWSPVLNEEFRRRYGEELSTFLPLLVEDLPGAEELRIRYRKTAEELFLKNFILPQREFCRRNGLFYTGHLSCDEGPFQNIIGHFSSPFRYLKMLDIPAIDDYLCDRNDQDYLGGRITEKKDRYMKFTDIRVHPLMIYKSAASVARQFHDGLLSCECLTFLGWDRKPVFWDLQMRFEIGMGVNMFTPHAFYYTLGGPAKEDCPPSYFLQQPGYEQFRPLFESWVHGAEILRRGTFHADVLLIFPERIYSAVRGSDLLNSFREREKRRTPELVTVEEEFSRTEFDLMRRHVGFDCAPEGFLIRDAQLEGRKLRLGACTYSTLLIPETVPLAPETESLLDTFRENGVRILRTGDRALLKPDLDIQGKDTEKILLHTRDLEDSREYYLLNLADHTLKPRLTLPGEFLLYDPLSRTAALCRDSLPEEMILPARSSCFLLRAEGFPCPILPFEESVFYGGRLERSPAEFIRALPRQANILRLPPGDSEISVRNGARICALYSEDLPDNAALQINGSAVPETPIAHHPADLCYRGCDVSLRIHPGRNRISGAEHVVYLAGEFRVSPEKHLLAPAPIQPGELAGQGYPCYWGTVEYHFTFSGKAEFLSLRMSGFAAVYLNGKFAGTISHSGERIPIAEHTLPAVNTVRILLSGSPAPFLTGEVESVGIFQCEIFRLPKKRKLRRSSGQNSFSK